MITPVESPATIHHTQSEGRGMLYVLITALLWSTTGTVQTLGPAGIDPLVVGPLRICIGGVLIWLWSRALGQGTQSRWSPTLVLIGAVTVAGYQLAFFSAVQLTGVVVSTITSIGTTPIFAGFLSRLVLKERLRPIWYAATALSIGGVVLLASADGTAELNMAGLWLATLAGASYAGQTVVIRRLVRFHPPEMVMARLFLVASLLVLPLLVLRPMGWMWSVHGVGTVLYLGVVPTSIAYIFFSKGLRSVEGATVSTISLAEPASAALLGVFLLGEVIPVRGVVGIVLISISLVMITVAAVIRARSGLPRPVR